MRERGRLSALVLCIAMATLLCACAHTPRLSDLDFAQLLQRLPGHYDNRQQADHIPLELYVARLDAALIGDNVFYMRLSAAGDARRVLSQRIWLFSQTKDGGIAQAVFVFAEPERWRQGDGNLQLFQALLTPDLHALKGCELSWKKTGALFEGETGASCKAGGVSGAGSLIEQHIVAASDSLALAERQFGAGGTLAVSTEADPFERFQRHSEADSSGGSPSRDESGKER